MYPIINNFNQEKINNYDFLKYDDINTNKIQDFLNLFNSIDKTDNDFLYIGYLFIQNNILSNISKILEKIPSLISSQFYD